MGKIDQQDLADTLQAFAEALGLHWYRYSEKLGGEIKDELLPESECDDEISTEVLEETKVVFKGTKTQLLFDGYRYRECTSPSDPVQVATLLGKVNAIAEFLGVEFEVSPKKVVAEKVKATKKKGKK